jgi:hypothetical protein
MTLTTHSVVGVAVAAVLPVNPVLGFAAGFVSHFVLDSIPHWDYPLRSLQRAGRKIDERLIGGRDFYVDALKVIVDATLGIILAILLIIIISNGHYRWELLIGSAGAISPDFLSFLYNKYRFKWIYPLQWFHMWLQEGYSLDNRPVIGVISQALVIVITFSLFL